MSPTTTKKGSSPSPERKTKQQASRVSVSIAFLVGLVVVCEGLYILKTSAGCISNGVSFKDELSASYTYNSKKEEEVQQQQKEEIVVAPPTTFSDSKWVSIANNESIQYRLWDYDPEPFPCVHAESRWEDVKVQRSPATEGLLFIRNMKTGSSTLGGITIRIGRAMAKRTKLPVHTSNRLTNELCKVRFDHTPAAYLNYKNRDKKKSFLFSFIRDPTKRITSEFFHFGVSRFKREPSTAAFQHYILTKSHLDNYFLFDMALDRFNGTTASWAEKKEAALSILKNYDFIGLTDRMDESLVVMKLLLGIEFQDILYLVAKGKGSFDDGAYGGKCHFIVPPYVSPGMKEWFEGPVWKEWSDGDTFLYNMVAKSLDKTIDKLGRDRVQREVALFQQLKTIATDLCLANTTFPCTPDGVFHRHDHDCLWWDSGCGYKCIDDMDHDTILADLEAKLDDDGNQ